MPALVEPAILAKWIEEHGCIGKVDRHWAWWQNPDGSRGLAPARPTPYLYRGQNRRYWSCVSSVNRGIHTRVWSLRDLEADEQMRLLARLIRANWYCEILNSHPVLEWAKSEQHSIDRMALAQHYEVPTGFIDLTESIEVALFFACCEFHDGRWQPRTHGKGILYRLDLTKTTPGEGPPVTGIGLQPFARPYAQWAWTMELTLEQDFEEHPTVDWVYFEHTRKMGEKLLDLFDGGNDLMPGDPLWHWASIVKTSRLLPLSNAIAVIEDLARDPLGLGKIDTTKLLRQIESANFVEFVSEVASPADPVTLSQIQADWERRKPDFLNSLKGQVFLVRTAPPGQEDPKKANE